MIRPASPLRVVHLVRSLEVGGLEFVVFHLASRSRGRVQPHVLCLEQRGPLADRLSAKGVTVECIGSPTTSISSSVLALRRRLVELNVEVLHTHNEKSHIHGALALTLLPGRRPSLIHTRHGRWQVPTVMSRLANRFAIARTRFVVCVSEDATSVALAEGARRERVRVLRNAIDVTAFTVPPYHQRSLGNRGVTVARLAPVKDIGTMLRAVGLIADRCPGFALDVVGDGPSRCELEKLASELGLGNKVRFHGESSEPSVFLTPAAVFLQSSLSEGISLTLLEAMAAGLPIVATDVGGNREVVHHNVTGFLVPPREPLALAASVVEILTNHERATEMGRRARERAETEFDLERMVDAYHLLYDEALKS